MTTRKCKICGKEYKVCPSCKAVRSFAPWRLLTCDPQEYQLFTILSKYDLDKDAACALESMDNIGIKQNQVDTYLPSVQNQISEIQKAVKSIAASKAKQTRSKTTTQKSDD